MVYPSKLFEQRDLENLPGISFDKDNKKTLFAEDLLVHGSEIRAIEETLGLGILGGYETVSERLDDMSGGGGGGGGVLEKIVLETTTPSVAFAYPISMDTETYLEVKVVIPGTMANVSYRVLINDDYSTSSYQRNRLHSIHSGTEVTTVATSNLGGLGSSSNDIVLMTWEFAKLAGKRLNIRSSVSRFSSFGDAEQEFSHISYRATTDDISDIKFVHDGSGFPPGSVFVLKGF